MTAKEGRKRSVRVLVAVGNGRGAAGEWGVGCEELVVEGGQAWPALSCVLSGFRLFPLIVF